MKLTSAARLVAAFIAALVAVTVVVPALPAAAVMSAVCNPTRLAPSPANIGDPADVFGTLNSFVTLSLRIDDPAATVTWCYRTADGTPAELARGNQAKVRITDDRRATSYFAVVTDAQGGVTQSGSAAMAVVRPPSALMSPPSTVSWVTEQGLDLVAGAQGGYGDRVRPIALWQTLGRSGQWVDAPARSMKMRLDGLQAVSTMTVRRSDPFYQDEFFVRVVWRICVVENETCARVIPGTERVDPTVTPVRLVAAPVVLNGLAETTYVEPGGSVALAVRADPTIPTEYLWERLRLGSAEWTVVSHEPVYQLNRVSQVDHLTQFRVTVKNPTGIAGTWYTKIFVNHLTFGTEADGYSPVALVNLLTDPTSGSLPLTLIRSSGASEIPKGTAQLETGMGITSSWHWSHLELNEWTDFRVGNTAWYMRVQYLFGQVSCFFSNGYGRVPGGLLRANWFGHTDPSANLSVNETIDGQPAVSTYVERSRFGREIPFECSNEVGLPYLWRGMDAAEQILSVANVKPVALEGDAPARLAEWACASAWVSKINCAFSGTATPVEVRISSQVSAAVNCRDGLQIRTAEVALAREATSSVNFSNSHSIQFELKFGATRGGEAGNPLALHAYFRTEYREDRGQTQGQSRTDTYIARLSLNKQQIGYMAAYTAAKQYTGDLLLKLGQHSYRMNDVQFVTTDADTIGTGKTWGVKNGDVNNPASTDKIPTYPVRTAFHVRPMTNDEVTRLCG